MTDPDLSMLALGSDLTTLGLILNSSRVCIGLIEPEYHLPSCYNVQPPPPAQPKIGSFSDETLFYIFYSMPRDILQEAAAQELLKKEYILMYESLEEWPITMLSSMGGSSPSSSLSSLITPTLQQAAAKQNLASNSMNIANLMNLGNLSSSVGRASGLNPGSLASLGTANPAQL
ncbi:CCR4-NOT core subunit CDC36 [Gigaspora margarita]|uniref:CCR4-NOT core subunit CDC36 n=1 Tax=Gigaspora margarita TaxID=4874 RepID=A0A8H4B008_GIGMA|nr:CCR4-NOT core subunit CDC36 [Gigaspora margarita]